MKVNLHTHTPHCRHASGTEREYIEKAIEAGYTHLGFSDHIPFVHADGHESKGLFPLCEVPEYFATLRALAEEYRDRITISVGFEMEYYPLYFRDMLRTATDHGADYLILGQHYIYNHEPTPRGKLHMFTPGHTAEDMITYADTVCEGMATGVFTYIAHPDVINYAGDDPLYEEQMRRVCEASLQYGLPLELNFTGVREDQRNYPDARFWRIAAELGCPVVFGCDAHSVRSVWRPETLEQAEQYVKDFGLEVIEFPELVCPKTGKRTPTR